MSFECWKCGACCKLAGFKDPALSRAPDDPTCKHLTEDNLCSIYESRPLFCVLNPERPEKEQAAWCRLMESNHELYATILTRGLTETPGCGTLPGKIDEGLPQGPSSPPVDDTKS